MACISPGERLPTLGTRSKTFNRGIMTQKSGTRSGAPCGVVATGLCFLLLAVLHPAEAIHRVMPDSIPESDIALHHSPQYPATAHEGHHHSEKPLDFSILNSLFEEEEEPQKGDVGGGMRFREQMGTEATVDARAGVEAHIGGMGLSQIDRLTDRVVNDALKRVGMEDPAEDEKEVQVYGSQDRFMSLDAQAHAPAEGQFSNLMEQSSRANRADRKRPRSQRGPSGVLLEEEAAIKEKDSTGVQGSTETEAVSMLETDAVVDDHSGTGLTGKTKEHVRKVKRTSRVPPPPPPPPAAEQAPSLAEEQAHVNTHEHTLSSANGKSRAQQRRELRELAKAKQKSKEDSKEHEHAANSDIAPDSLENRRKPQPSSTELFSAIRRHLKKIPKFDPNKHEPFADMSRKNNRYLNKNARFAEVLRRMGTGVKDDPQSTAGAAFEYQPSPFKHPPPPPVPPPPPPPPPPDFGPESAFSGYQFGTVGGEAANTEGSFSSLWEKTYPIDSPFHPHRSGKSSKDHLPRFVQEQLAQDSAHSVLLEEDSSSTATGAPRAHRDFVNARIPHPDDYLRVYADYAHPHYPELQQYVIPAMY